MTDTNHTDSVEAKIEETLNEFDKIDWDYNLRKPTNSEVLSGGKSTTRLQKKAVLQKLIDITLQAPHSQQVEEAVRKLTLHLSVILPMAKGYVHTHDVGRNREMVSNAEDYLAELEGD